MFPCGEGHSVRPHLDTIQVTLDTCVIHVYGGTYVNGPTNPESRENLSKSSATKVLMTPSASEITRILLLDG